MPLDQIVPGLVGMSLFGLPGLYFASLLLRAASSRRWPVVKGRVTESKVLVSKSRKGQTNARVAYEYAVGGRTYRCDVVRFGDFLDFNGRSAARVVAGYAVGQEVDVHHHPRRPRVATLQPRASGFLLVWALLSLGAVATLGWGFLAETGEPPSAEAPAPPGPTPP